MVTLMIRAAKIPLNLIKSLFILLNNKTLFFDTTHLRTYMVHLFSFLHGLVHSLYGLAVPQFLEPVPFPPPTKIGSSRNRFQEIQRKT